MDVIGLLDDKTYNIVQDDLVNGVVDPKDVLEWMPLDHEIKNWTNR